MSFCYIPSENIHQMFKLTYPMPFLTVPYDKDVMAEKIQQYQDGADISDVWPELPAEIRECFTSGIAPQAFKKMYEDTATPEANEIDGYSRKYVMMYVTEEELQRLAAAESSKAWGDICDEIKLKRGGHYPSLWYQIVVVSGLVGEMQSRWKNKNSEVQHGA